MRELMKLMKARRASIDGDSKLFTDTLREWSDDYADDPPAQFDVLAGDERRVFIEKMALLPWDEYEKALLDEHSEMGAMVELGDSMIEIEVSRRRSELSRNRKPS